MPLNTDLLDAAVNFARRTHDRVTLVEVNGAPAVWDQTSWARPADCGSAFCIAGYLASQHPGYTQEVVYSSFYGRQLRAKINGHDFFYPAVAAEMLGIAEDEEFDGNDGFTELGRALARLWQPHNTLEGIERIAAEIKELAL